MSAPAFTFKYAGISDEQFAFFSEFAPAPSEAYNFQVTNRFPHQFSTRMVGCEVIVDFANAATEKIFVRAALTCVFQLDEESWINRLISSGDGVRMEEEIFAHFTAFTIGSLRGFVHAKTHGKGVNVLVPPVNALALVSKMTEEERIIKAVSE